MHENSTIPLRTSAGDRSADTARLVNAFLGGRLAEAQTTTAVNEKLDRDRA